MADQRLLGWSAGLAFAGLIGLAMSNADDAPKTGTQPTSGANSTYNKYVPPTYNYPPPTYTYAPPTYTNAPAPTYVYTPPTYQAPPPQPAPVQRYVPTPVPEEPKQESAYYKNCAAARDAGAAPLREGDPGYRSALDRDGDGIACE